MAECSNSNDELITATFHKWKYGHYFKVVEEGSKNIKVRCTLCPPNKTLSSARNTTSSFKAHLARVHKNVILVAKVVLQVNGKGKRKKVSDDQHSEASQPKKQCTLSSNGVPSTRLRNLLSECYRRHATIVNCRITCLSKIDWRSLLYTCPRQKFFHFIFG